MYKKKRNVCEHTEGLCMDFLHCLEWLPATVAPKWFVCFCWNFFILHTLFLENEYFLIIESKTSKVGSAFKYHELMQCQNRPPKLCQISSWGNQNSYIDSARWMNKKPNSVKISVSL